MNPSYVELSYFQLALAASLIVVNAAISIALKLRLTASLLLAAVRTVVQLLLVGLVLQQVFAWGTWYTTLAVMAVMTVIAGVTAAARTDRPYPGIWLDCLVSMWASSWLITAIALVAIVQIHPWYLPQYSIPLLGMVLGNTLNGISLGIDRLTAELFDHRDQVEGVLSLGGTRWEAARLPVRRAVRTGTIPIINAMMVVGIVSLPGMMTGQLLAGVEPAQAVKYQIVIMFLIAASTAGGTVAAVLLSYRRLFNSRHQFLGGVIHKRA